MTTAHSLDLPEPGPFLLTPADRHAVASQRALGRLALVLARQDAPECQPVHLYRARRRFTAAARIVRAARFLPRLDA